MTPTTETPDFEALRAKRNAAVRKAATDYGLHLFKFNADACFCDCGSGGPCEHKWNGKGCDTMGGWSATCSRCGVTALSHDLRNAP